MHVMVRHVLGDDKHPWWMLVHTASYKCHELKGVHACSYTKLAATILIISLVSYYEKDPSKKKAQIYWKDWSNYVVASWYSYIMIDTQGDITVRFIAIYNRIIHIQVHNFKSQKFYVFNKKMKTLISHFLAVQHICT